MNNINKNVLITPLTLSGGTTSEALDMQGYEGVLFLVKFSTGNASNAVKAQQGAESDLSDAADLTGASITPGASITYAWLDFYKPTERYVRMVATLGAGSVSAALALRYGPDDAPVDNDTDDITGTFVTSPAESA